MVDEIDSFGMCLKKTNVFVDWEPRFIYVCLSTTFKIFALTQYFDFIHELYMRNICYLMLSVL